jgi:exonuclease III
VSNGFKLTTVSQFIITIFWQIINTYFAEGSKMEKYIIDRLSELAKLLNIINEKLELIQKSIIIGMKINGKLHGLDLNIAPDEIDDSLLDQK